MQADRAAALLVVAALGACTTPKHAWVTAGAGVVVAGTSGLMLDRQTGLGSDAAEVEVMMLFAGALTVVASLASLPYLYAFPPPAPKEADPACLAERETIATRAQRIADLGQRTRVLITMPRCR